MEKKFNIKNLINTEKLKPIAQVKRVDSAKRPAVKNTKLTGEELSKDEFIVSQFIYDLKCESVLQTKDKVNMVISMYEGDSEIKICTAFEISFNYKDLIESGECNHVKIKCKSNIGNMVIGVIHMMLPGLCLQCISPAWREGQSLADLIEENMDDLN